MRPMRDRATGPDRCGHQCRLSQMRIRGAGSARLPGVKLDTIDALRRERDGDSHQLLVEDRDCPFFEDGLVERPERLHPFGGVGVQIREVAKLFHVMHGNILSLKN